MAVTFGLEGWSLDRLEVSQPRQEAASQDGSPLSSIKSSRHILQMASPSTTIASVEPVGICSSSIQTREMTPQIEH